MSLPLTRETGAGPPTDPPEARPAPVDEPVPTATDGAGRRGRRVVGFCLAALGLSLVVLVARDGSPPWQVARALGGIGVLAGALWVERRAAGAWRGAAAFTAGMVGLAVGIGIGLPHLAKDGDVVTTLLGVASLLAGLVLWVVGGIGLIRSVRPWWRLAVALVLLVVTYVIVYSLGVAVAATNVPATEVGSETPGDRGLAYRDVTFETADGVQLSGWYVPGRNGAAVVALHGAGSTRSNVLDEAEVLAQNGYGVLLYDARGHGRSAGRAMDFGWYGDQDIAAAVDFLEDQADVEQGRIGAVGLSMGGEQVIGASAGDDRLAAVVAEGATNRVTADKAWLSDEYGLRGGIQEGIEWLIYHATDVLTAAGPPTALRDATGAAGHDPVLLIAAGRVPDEAHAAAHIEGGAPEDVEVWVAEDADHTGALEAHPDEWERRVIGFLDDALGGPESP